VVQGGTWLAFPGFAMTTAILSSSDRTELWEDLEKDGYGHSQAWTVHQESSWEEGPVSIPTLEPIRLYLREISRLPLLAREQEVDLARRIEKGRRDILRILNAIPWAARKLAPRKAHDRVDATLADLTQIEREIGLLEAQPPARQRCRRLRAVEHEIGMPLTQFRELLARAVDRAHAVDWARQALIEANLRLVVMVAKRYPEHGLSLPDLIQYGNLGLMRAVDRFDYRRGFKFSTYAIWWIRQALTHAIGDFGRTVRLPQHVVESLRQLDKTKRTLSAQLHREPTVSEIAELAGIPIEQVHSLLTVGRKPASFDTASGDNLKLAESIIVSEKASAEDILFRREERLRVSRALALLSHREREIVRRRFGIGTDRPYTLEEIGQQFSLTRERIRQIEASTLKKLRRTLSDRSAPVQESWTADYGSDAAA
jgi:RNA polymerase sigma factor (sigma-70 family)